MNIWWVAVAVMVAAGNSFGAGVPCDKGKKAFSENVYKAVFAAKNCLKCHGQKNPKNEAPQFMNDETVAYARALRLTNFSDVPKSRLVKKGGDGHCEELGEKCGVSADDLTKAIGKWNDGGQTDCKTTVLTAPLPKEVYDSFKPQVMSWSLDVLGKDFAKAYFEVTVTALPDKVTTGRRIAFSRPRLATFEKTVRIRTVRFRVLGEEGTESFDQISAVREPWKLGENEMDRSLFPVLSSEVVRVDIPEKAEVEFSFEKLEIVAAGVPCHFPKVFATDVMPQLERCRHCHEVKPDDPIRKRQASGFLMRQGSLADYCQSVKSAAMSKVPLFTPFLGAFGNSGVHPKLVFPFPKPGEDRNRIMRWLAEEAKGDK